MQTAVRHIGISRRRKEDVMASEIMEKVVSKLSEYLQIDKSMISAETDIQRDLGADSLMIVELLFALESEYDITIPDEVVETLKTVGDLVAYLETVIK